MVSHSFEFQPGLVVSNDGDVLFSGQSLQGLVEEFGSPLYVLNEEVIRENCRRYLHYFSNSYPDIRIAYASKAFLCRAICSIIASEGLSLDVVSGGELFTALSAGFPAERIIFHGINRTEEELTLALSNGVGRIVVDNWPELYRIAKVAASLHTTAHLLVRVASGIVAHTHQYVQTSKPDSKFGFVPEELPHVLAICATLSEIKVVGLHCHIGSQILTIDPFVENLKLLLEHYAAAANSGHTLEELNLGGGLGVFYTEDDQVPLIADLCRVIAETALTESARLQINPPRLVLEPGRSIINDAGLTIYTVGGGKDIPGVRKYVFVDGGMSDNIRPALYSSRYQVANISRISEPANEQVSVAGRCCESGDMLIWDAYLPPTQVGDLLVVGRTGAYSFAMASNYNRLPRPAMVLLRGSEAHLIIRRETYDDLLRLDCLPDHLANKN